MVCVLFCCCVVDVVVFGEEGAGVMVMVVLMFNVSVHICCFMY